MADNKPTPETAAAEKAPPAAPERPAPEPSLGKVFAAAREKRGFSQSVVSKDAHIPPYYVRMIESNDYTLISDQLYLLPFLRRYATFLGLDPEEVASRFIREVQRADVSAARMSQPIHMPDPSRRKSWRRVAAIVVAVIAALVIADLGYRYVFQPRKSGLPGSPAAPSATASPASAPVAAPAIPAVPVAPAASSTPESRVVPRPARPPVQGSRSAVPQPAIP